MGTRDLLVRILVANRRFVFLIARKEPGTLVAWKLGAKMNQRELQFDGICKSTLLFRADDVIDHVRLQCNQVLQSAQKNEDGDGLSEA
jgi:hypothetical protein